MKMIKPVTGGYSDVKQRPGRPLNARTVEIAEKLRECAEAGRRQVVVELEGKEQEKFSRFSSRARMAAKSVGACVRVRRLSDGERAEITLLGG